jgi:CheY-like chemotaxis protein
MAGMSILYIDDSPTHLESVKQTLTAKGYELRTASNVTEALVHLKDGVVEIVIIDYLMPGMTGAEVLQELKKQNLPNKEIRYLLYTTDIKIHLEYHKLGFDGALILKGNHSALLEQLDPIIRYQKLRKIRRGVTG